MRCWPTWKRKVAAWHNSSRKKLLKYMDDRLAFVADDDTAYVMDDFGTLRAVPFTLPAFFFNET